MQVHLIGGQPVGVPLLVVVVDQEGREAEGGEELPHLAVLGSVAEEQGQGAHVFPGRETDVTVM